MKKLFLLIAVCTVGIPLGAQVSLGVKGGLTIPNITPSGTNPLSEGYSSFLTGGGGIFAEYRLTEKFSLQVGLEYSRQGGKKNGLQALPVAPIKEQFMAMLAQSPMSQSFNGLDRLLGGLFPADYLYAEFDGKAKFDYLMLPVQAKMGWNLSKNSPWRVYASLGIFGSYLLSAERISTGTSPFYVDAAGTTNFYDLAYNTTFNALVVGLPQQFPGQINTEEEARAAAARILESNGFSALQAFRYQSNSEEITHEIHPFNFGVIGGIGFSCRLCERHRIFIEGGANFGFRKIQKSAENGQSRIGSGSVMLGYSFSL